MLSLWRQISTDFFWNISVSRRPHHKRKFYYDLSSGFEFNKMSKAKRDIVIAQRSNGSVCEMLQSLEFGDPIVTSGFKRLGKEI